MEGWSAFGYDFRDQFVANGVRGEVFVRPEKEAAMPVVSRLIRNVPALFLRDYFAARKIPLSDDVDWDAKRPKLRKVLMEAVKALDHSINDMVRTDAEHIDAMTDEAGQTALKGRATDEQKEALAEIDSAHARALWMFVHDHDRFRYAEESASFDRARNKSTWDAFVAPIDLTVDQGKKARKALASELADFFREDGKVRVRVEVFERTREEEEDDEQVIPDKENGYKFTLDIHKFYQFVQFGGKAESQVGLGSGIDHSCNLGMIVLEKDSFDSEFYFF